MVAWWLGLTHVYYEIESINAGLKSIYAGKVLRTDGPEDKADNRVRMIA